MTLHVALCGPATLSELQPHVADPIVARGYPFPLIPTLSEAFLALGMKVTVVTSSIDIEAPERHSSGAFDLRIIPMRARARDRALDLFRLERRRIASELRQIAPDVVHAHWTYEFALGALAARAAPVLVTAHDAPLTVLRHLPDPYRALRAIMATRVSIARPALTAVSPYLATRWRKEMRFSGDIEVIPNPVPTLSHRPAHGRADRERVLSIGNSTPLKNITTLLRAFDVVRASRPAAELRLVGPGLGSDGEIARWARVRGLQNGVRFLGPLEREQVAVELGSARVYCHPSLEESQGMSLLEAIGAELPIVAGRDSGAVPWTLFDGAAGLLVDVRSPAEVAAGILACFRDPAIGRPGGDRLTLMLEERFGRDAVSRAYLTAYLALRGR